MKKINLAILSLLTVLSYGFINKTLVQNPVFYDGNSRLADSVFKTMTPEERIGQLFMVAAYSNKDNAHIKEIKKLIKENSIEAIQFEFNQMNIQSRTFFKDFMDILDGYTFFRITSFGLIPLDNYSPIKNEIFAYQNIFSIKKN